MGQSSQLGGERALRANVRLLGDVLGRVLIEQEGAGVPRARGADP